MEEYKNTFITIINSAKDQLEKEEYSELIECIKTIILAED